MKQVRFRAFALFAAMTLALGLVVAQQENQEALEDVAQQWQERYNEGDVEGVVELYTQDAILYAPDGTVHEGRDAIREEVQGLIDAGFTQISIDPPETEVLNDTAYGINSYTFMDAEGEAVSEGYVMVIFTRENDEWRIHRHIANMALPEEEMAAQDEPAPAPRGAFVQPTELVLRTADQTFEVPDASEVVVEIWTAPEEMTFPWHTHEAPLLVIVNSGQFTRQYEDCSTSVYGPGEVSLHPGHPADQVHRAHVTAGTELGFVLFGVPPGEDGADYDVEAPDCPDPTS